MKKKSFRFRALSILGIAVIGLFNFAFAGEHPGKKIEGKKAEEVLAAAKIFIEEDSALKGAFLVWDDVEKKPRNLEFQKFHAVFQLDNGDYFFCSDFKDDKNVLDMDFVLIPQGDGYKVKALWIHKVNGKKRKPKMKM